MSNVKPGRQRIKNLLFKLNDEDRNTLVCLIAKAGYSVRIGKERPEGRGQKVSFAGIIWKEDKELGFKKRGETYESVKN